MIIDFHTHTFPEKISKRVLDKLGRLACIRPHTEGHYASLAQSMKEGSVDYSVNLPVVTAPEQTHAINEAMIRKKDDLFAMGIITFGGMHPDSPNVRQELSALAAAGIRGIKLHPAYQGADFDDPRFLRIVDTASELGLIIVVHAGIDIGLYDHNYVSVPHILNVLNTVHPEKLVLAHMGGWNGWDDVERDLAGAPVWLDSAFSIGPVDPFPGAVPGPYSSVTMSDAQFLRLSRKHGMDKVLFATDSPWQDQKQYVERHRALGLTEEEQELFFHKNAEKLLNMNL